jgi:hypothetical protein
VKGRGDNLRRLLRTPRLKPDEGLVGYLVRLTEENSYDSPTWITSTAGLKVNFRKGGWASLYFGQADLTRLEHLAGLRPGGLAHVKYLARAPDQGSGMLIDFWGRGVPINSVRFCSPKVCSSCLSEESYCRKLWDLLPMTACPAHGTVLEDACASCAESITWERGSVCICPCGYDWRRGHPAEAHPAALAIARQIYRLCGRAFSGAPSARGGASPLYSLSLAKLCGVLFLIADHYLFWKEGRRLTTSESNRVCHDLYARAYEAFGRWPRRFHYFLDEYGFLREGESSSAELLRHLHSQAAKSAPDFMVAELEEYCLGVSTLAARPGCLIHLLDRRFARKKEVCAFYHLNEEVLETCIRAGQIRTFSAGVGRETLIDTRCVSELVAILRSYPDAAEIADRLCISAIDVDDLVRHGCLYPCMGMGGVGRDRWRFPPDEAERLIGEVGRMLREGESIPSGELLPIHDVTRLVDKKGYSYGRFVRDMLDGKLAPAVKLRRRGLSGFAFPKRNVYEYFRRLSISLGANRGRRFNYKLRARALEVMRERNLRMNNSSAEKRDNISESIGLSVWDIARTAKEVLSRASPARIRS